MNSLGREKIFGELESVSEELSGFGVERIGLFGSQLRNEAGEDSDIDFLVVFEENSFDSYMGLKLFLEELFGVEVDLVIESDIRPELEGVKEDAEYVTPA